MVAALAPPLGLADVFPPDAPLTVDSPMADLLAYAAFAEDAVGGTLEMFAKTVPVPPEGVSSTTVTIPGADGNEITLLISRPGHADGPLPAVVHFHGGAMAIASAADTSYQRLRESMAATGLVVVGVEFRNSGGRLGAHPYRRGG